MTLSKRYEPYGEVLSSVGNATSIYGYSGELQEGSQVFLRSRYYDSVNGRFLSRDTWEGDNRIPMSNNIWLYVYSNPVNLKDPFGKYPCDFLSQGESSEVPQCRIDATGVKKYDEKVKPTHVHFTPTSVASYVNGVPLDDPQAQLHIPGHTSDTGLCGTISVAWIITHSLPNLKVDNVYDAFKALLVADKIWKCETYSDGTCKTDEKGNFIRTTDQNYTGDYHLGALINLAYWGFFDAKYGRTNSVESLVTWSGRHAIAYEKSYWITGIKASGSTGQLRNGWQWDNYNGKFEGSGGSHWVVITGFSDEWDLFPDYPGDEPSHAKWVRIFNPFGNRLEYYWWGDFRNSWTEDKGTYVIANKRTEGVYRDIDQ